MAKDFAGLSNSISSLASKIVVNSDRRKRVTALAIDQNAVQETPVDEGRARSNWQVSVATPITTSIEAYSKGSKGSTGASNASAAIAQAQTALAGSVEGQSVFIVNNLPYIIPLNQGHSALVNPGWIERAINRGVEAGRKISVVEKT